MNRPADPGQVSARTSRPVKGVVAVAVVALAVVVGVTVTSHHDDRRAAAPTPPVGAVRTPSSSTPSPAPTRSNSAPWTETFDGPAGSPVAPSLFTPRTGGNGWGNDELESYTTRPSNVSLDGHGHAVLTAVKERFTGTDGYTRNWTSGRLDSLDAWSFTTGTLSVRMRSPAVGGMWAAFWLMGTDLPTVGWPTCGEVDVIETVGTKRLAFQTVHGPTQSDNGAFQASPTASIAARTLARPDGFHDYAITRTTRSMTFRVDGRVTGTIAVKSLKRGQRWVFDKPMFMILNLAVGGWAGAPTVDRAAVVVDAISFRPT